MQIQIDPEFKALIPPLSSTEREQLEANILADGCLDSLKLWSGILLDGHNRFEICSKHGMPFKTEDILVDSREDAIIWICKNQMGRRNIADAQKTYLLGKQYEARKVTEARNQYTKPASGQSDQQQTSEKIAAEMSIGERSVRRAEKYARGLDAIGESAPELKANILSGKSHAVKKDISAIALMTEPARRDAIEKIKNGERVQRPKMTTPEHENTVLRDTPNDFSFLTEEHKLIEDNSEFDSFMDNSAEAAELMRVLDLER